MAIRIMIVGQIATVFRILPRVTGKRASQALAVLIGTIGDPGIIERDYRGDIRLTRATAALRATRASACRQESQ